MFEKVKCCVRTSCSKIKCIPTACVAVPAMLIAAALIIRIFSGGNSGCNMYKFSGGVGLFPGMLLYTVGYLIRLILCGELLASALFSCRIEKRFVPTLFAALLCFMMLFEYKLIFIMHRFFIAAVMSLLCGGAAFISLLYQKGCAKAISISALIYMVLQAIFFVQTVSLIFCL